MYSSPSIIRVNKFNKGGEFLDQLNDYTSISKTLLYGIIMLRYFGNYNCRHKDLNQSELRICDFCLQVWSLFILASVRLVRAEVGIYC
jgi:hypothetical protein